jgi:UDPglucose 6-dehydrogenase
MIKSTISLEGWDQLAEKFPNHQITFSPEFLRAATADADVKNTTHVFLAGGNTDYWRDFYSFAFPEAKITICLPQEAIAIKYFRNSFLATKCSFFNEVYDFCQAIGLDYNNVRYGIAADSRIGDSHTFIEPLARGWGGYCFPKDTSALLKMAENNNVNLNTLDAAVKSNDIIRKK